MVAVGTVVFPQNLKYFEKFLSSLQQQTSKNFSVFIINDGCGDLADYVKGLENVTTENYSSDPFSNRLALIRLAVRSGCKKLIFGDSDDWFGQNRVEVLSKLLDKYDIVSTDMTLVDDNGGILKENYWKSRLKASTVSSDFLKDKNIFGFGNSAISLEFQINDFDGLFSSPAPDWYFFSQLATGRRMYYTNETLVYYRQHPNNMIGLGRVTPERLLNIVNVKCRHYQACRAAGLEVEPYLSEMNALRVRFHNRSVLEVAARKLDNLKKTFLWWEETNYL